VPNACTAIKAHTVFELFDRREAKPVHGIGRDREAGRRANAGPIAVGPVRVGEHADLGARPARDNSARAIAVAPHRGDDLALDQLRELGTESRRRVAPRRIS